MSAPPPERLSAAAPLIDPEWRARHAAAARKAGISPRLSREMVLLVNEGYLSLAAAQNEPGAFGRAKAARDAAVSGRRQVSIHLPLGLLKAVDRLAAYEGISRSKAVAALLRHGLGT